MKWHKKLKHRITCIFGIRDSRSRNQNRNNVNKDDTVRICTVQEDYPEHLNPFTSESSPKNDAHYQYELNRFEDENTIVNEHNFSTENSKAEVETEKNDDYLATLNQFGDNQNEIGHNEYSKGFSHDKDNSPLVENKNKEDCFPTPLKDNNCDSQRAGSNINIDCEDSKVCLYANKNPVEISATHRDYSEKSSVGTFAKNLSKPRKFRKKYPAPKPPQSTCHIEKEVKVIINSPKRESDLKEEEIFKQSLKKTTALSSPDPKKFNDLDSVSSESPSIQPQYREDKEKQICNFKVKHAGADMNQPFKKSLNKTQKSLSENEISSKKSQPRIKMSLLSKLRYSNSSPDLVSETKVFNATFFEDKKQFQDIIKNIKRETPLVAVSSVPQQETTENIKMNPVLPVSVKSSQETIVKVHRKAPLPPTVKISPQKLTVSSVPQQETAGNVKMKTPVLSVSVKSSQETIVKVHRKAPLPPAVNISPEQLTVSSLPQQETAGNIKMKTGALTVSVKSRQETREKVHRKAPLPPTVKISNVKTTQAPKKTGMRKLQKFFTNAFMKN